MSTAHVHSFSRNQRRALGWSTARRCSYGLNVYLQALDHTTQRITVLGISNLITLLLLQDCKNEALFELTHRLRVSQCHPWTYAVRERAEPSRRILPSLVLLVGTSFSRPRRVGRQPNSQRAMWFIVSGLQPVEKRVPENCAVEFQSALSAQQSWSYSFAGRIFARCTVKITRHPPYRRQELGRQQTTTAGPKSD